MQWLGTLGVDPAVAPVVHSLEQAMAGEGDVFAVPARQVVSVPLWLDSEDSVVIDSAVLLEMEVRDLPPRASCPMPPSAASLRRMGVRSSWSRSFRRISRSVSPMSRPSGMMFLPPSCRSRRMP